MVSSPTISRQARRHPPQGVSLSTCDGHREPAEAEYLSHPLWSASALATWAKLQECCSDYLKSSIKPPVLLGRYFADKARGCVAVTRWAQTRSSPARRSGCFVQGSDNHRASSSNRERHDTRLPSAPHSSWRTAREWPNDYGLPGPPPLRCPRPDECPSAPDRGDNLQPD